LAHQKNKQNTPNPSDIVPDRDQTKKIREQCSSDLCCALFMRRWIGSLTSIISSLASERVMSTIAHVDSISIRLVGVWSRQQTPVTSSFVQLLSLCPFAKSRRTFVGQGVIRAAMTFCGFRKLDGQFFTHKSKHEACTQLRLR
jgi:hypothetical protein